MTQSSSSPAICIVDDDPLVRKTISNILSDDGYAVVDYDSGGAFLTSLKEAGNISHYGCLLLDVKMPDMDGIQVLHELSDRKVELPVVMISGQGDISTAVEAMRNGAIDFIEKPFTPELLSAAVNKNYKAAEPSGSNSSGSLTNLSQRELEVLKLLVEGDANKMIAFKLGTSQRTVEAHRARIMERLEVRTFAELVRKAIAAGL